LERHDTFQLIHVNAELSSRRQDDIDRRKAMPVIDAFIIAAIVAAFVIFGVVLAWAEYQTRHLPRKTRLRFETDRG
jgi:multisubunit Na+/H+ antiporter MnhC subunit